MVARPPHSNLALAAADAGEYCRTLKHRGQALGSMPGPGWRAWPWLSTPMRRTAGPLPSQRNPRTASSPCSFIRAPVHTHASSCTLCNNPPGCVWSAACHPDHDAPLLWPSSVADQREELVGRKGKILLTQSEVVSFVLALELCSGLGQCITLTREKQRVQLWLMRDCILVL